MGYTHYWRRLPAFDPAKFAAAVEDCRKLCTALPIPLGDGMGENEPEFSAEGIRFNGHVNSGQMSSIARTAESLCWPSEKAAGIAIVGEPEPEVGHWVGGDVQNARILPENGDGSYEAFAVEQAIDTAQRGEADQKGRYFDCTKTNFRPYDLCVQSCLIALKEHLGDAIRVTSDGTDEQWNEARDACQVFLGYGLLFQLDANTPDSLPDAPKPKRESLPDISRDEAIKRIRAGLRRRSGKAWSVTGGRGTAWGWITIDAPPARRKWQHVQTDKIGSDGLPEYEEVHRPDAQFGHMGPDDRAELAKLLGVDEKSVHQGESIPASSAYYWEFIDRAEGREPRIHGTRYWD